MEQVEVQREIGCVISQGNELSLWYWEPWSKIPLDSFIDYEKSR